MKFIFSVYLDRLVLYLCTNTVFDSVMQCLFVLLRNDVHVTNQDFQMCQRELNLFRSVFTRSKTLLTLSSSLSPLFSLSSFVLLIIPSSAYCCDVLSLLTHSPLCTQIFTGEREGKKRKLEVQAFLWDIIYVIACSYTKPKGKARHPSASLPLIVDVKKDSTFPI